MRQRQKTVLSLVMAFLAVILLVQLSLLSGALEAYMSGDGVIGLPAAFASGACLLASAWLLRSIK